MGRCIPATTAHFLHKVNPIESSGLATESSL
jgi:hypothetical protein